MHRRNQASMAFVFEELEPRIMYSADFAPGLVDEAGWQLDTEVRLAEDATLAPSTQAEQRRKEIVFIDAAVEDYRVLIDAIDRERGAQADLAFFLIDAEHDGVQQITAALDQRRGVDAVHVISHGSEASLRLGSTMLDAQNLASYAELLQQWGSALAPEADLLLYGCDVARSAEGAAFLRQIGTLTGADVAASSDATGVASGGGDWELEQHFGNVEVGTIGASAAVGSWGGLLGNEFLVNTTTNNDQDTSALTRGSQQAIAYDAAGNFVVVWASKSQDDTGTDGVYARRFADDGTPLTGEILVNTTVADDQNMARVVSDAAGNFVVTWTSNQQDGNGSGVYVRRFDANGVALTGEIAVNTTTSGDQENSVIAMNRGSGAFVVAWQGEGTGDADGIFFRRYAADGTALDATERRVNTSDSGAEGNPAAAMDTSGRFVVAFEVNNKMYFQRFDATGALQGTRVQVDNPVSNSTGAAIAMDDAGNFTLVYREQSILTGVWGRGYMSDGTQRYTWFHPATGDASSPSIAMAGDGAFVITYQKTGANGIDIYAFKHNADGSGNGTALVVNQTTTSDQVAPSIALLSTDHFTVVWSGEGAADAKGVSARIFSPANTAPVVGLSGALINYTDGDGPTLIDASATVTDAESPNFSTGTLTIAFAANGSVHDRLLINNQGAATGQIGVTGNTITYGGITIGSFVGTTDGATPLVVTFNYAATPAAAQALLRNIQYHNVSTTPSTLTRTVQAVLTDGDGGTSNVVTKSVQVADASQPPASAGGSVTSVEDAARVFVWADFNITDADSPIGATTAVRLTTLPAVDVLEYFNGRAWTRAGLGQVFTKSDIDAGLLRLMPLGDESGYDGYASAGVGNLKQDYAQFSFTPIQAAIETIINPGGEADGLADNGVWQNGAIGWSHAGNNAGVQNVVAGPDTFVIDDDASLFVDAGGSITQTLAATFSSARNYSLSFEFGWRGDTGFYPTEPGFKIELYAGSTLLGEFNETYIAGEPGKFVAGVLAVDGSLSGATNGSALQIKLTGISSQANFDNLQLISFDRDTDIGAAAQMTVDVTPVNDAPINSLPGPLSVNEDVALPIAGLSIADVDAATASTQLIVGNGTLNVNLTGGAVISAGANNSSSLTLTGSLAQVNAALATLSYQGNLNFNGSDSLQIVTNDLGGFGTGGALSDTDSLAITVDAVNDAPVITSNGGGVSASVTIAEGGTSVTTVVATDADLPAPALTYAIVGGADAAKFTINPATGALSFVGAQNLEAPTDANVDNVYEVSVRASDGTNADTQSLSVSLIDVNDAPVLDTAKSPTLDPISQGSGAPVGAVGTLVSQLVDFAPPAGGVDNVADEDSGALLGVAVTVADTANGTTWYSTDNGVNWSALGPVSDAGARLLAADGNTRIYFQANATFSGSLSSAITFRAWDRTVGSNGDLASVLVNGGGTAFSSASDTVALTVNPETTPIANDDSTIVSAGTLAAIDVRANDVSVTGNSLAVLEVTQASHGSVTLDAGGVLNYTSANGYVGTDSFGYIVRDVGDGLSHYWRLDGSAADAIGGANGSLVNGPATVLGKYGDALQFDGVNDYAALPDVSYANEFTLSFWFKLADNAGNGYRYIYSHGAAGAQNSVNVFFIENATVTGTGINNVLRTRLLDANDSDDVSGLDISATGLADNQWHLYTLTTTTGTGARVYVDGVQRAADANGGNAINPTGSLHLGANDTLSAARFLKGSVDGVALYAGGATSTEIGTLFDGGTARATVTVAVTNNVPVITSNGGGPTASVGVVENSSLVTTLNANDSDSPAQGLTYSISGGADSAKFTIDSDTGELQFISAPDYDTPGDVGSDNIYDVTVQATDSAGGTDTQAIRVSVTNMNESPSFAAQTFTLAENSPHGTLVGNASASDVDAGDTLTYSITAGNSGGAFSIDAAGQIQVANSAALNFEATPTFNLTVLVIDAGGLSNSAVITVNLTNVNEAPMNVVPGALSVNEDVALPIASISVNDVDGNIASVQASVANGRINVSLAGGASINAGANGSASLRLSGTQAQINAALASIVYQANADFNGGDVLTIASSDAATLNDTSTVNITVNPLNDAPLAADDSYGVNENGSLTLGALGGVLSNDSDVENSALSAALVSAPTNGTLALNANGSFVYTPNASFNGTDSFTYRSSDGSLDSNIATVTINVSSVNTAPFIVANASANIAEGGSVAIDSGHLRVDDFDNSPAQIVYTLTNAPSSGVLTRGGAVLTSGSQYTQQDIDANALWYTHDGGESIGDMFAFTVSDGLGGNIAATPFVLNIASVNDAPAIISNGGGASAALTVTENAVAVTTVVANDADLPVNALSYAISGGADAAWFAIDGTTGLLSFVTAPNFEAPLDANSDNMYEVIVRADDGNGGTATQALHVSIANLNEIPVNVLPGSLSATEDAPASIGGLSVADPDSNLATVSVSVAHGVLNVDLAAGANISAGANASAALTLAGTQSQINAALASIGYTPSLNFSGNDNLSIVSVDSGGQTDADGIAIDVAPTNDAPSIIAAQFTIAEGAGITLSASEIGAVDVEQNASQLTLTVSAIAGGYLEFIDHPGAAITLFTQADIEAGRVRFIHDGGEAAPNLVIAVSDFVASDGPRSVAIGFASINDVPALAVGSASFGENATVAIDASRLMSNDADNTASQLVFTLLSGPSAGHLEFSDNPGVVVTRFTQADIDSGRLRYVHTGSGQDDSFAFSVSDGRTSIRATFSLYATAPGGDSPAFASLPGTGIQDSGETAPQTSTSESVPLSTEAKPAAPNPSSFSIVLRVEPEASSPVIVAVAPDSSAGTTAASVPVSVVSSRRTAAMPSLALSSAVQASALPVNFALSLEGGDNGRAGSAVTVELSDTRYLRQLDEARQRSASEMKFDQIAIGSSIAASTSLSIGYVLWLLRGGVLVSSLLSSLPAWRMVDPLPVLGKVKNDDDDEDEESLQSLVKKHWDKRRDRAAVSAGTDAEESRPPGLGLVS